MLARPEHTEAARLSRLSRRHQMTHRPQTRPLPLQPPPWRRLLLFFCIFEFILLGTYKELVASDLLKVDMYTLLTSRELMRERESFSGILVLGSAR